MLVIVWVVPFAAENLAFSFRVQMTVASGSPVKIQVRMNTGGSAVGVVWRLKWSLPKISTAPEKGAEKISEVFFHGLAQLHVLA